jgi:hypothetical protein
VRAQWAGKPFVWHIYPQDENLHHKKLRAFLQRYAPDIDSLQGFMLHWNGAQADAANWPALWSALAGDQARIEARSRDWQARMLENGDLATNLLAFSDSLRASLR